MIVNVDAKQLDWLCAVWLSGDKTGREEIGNNVDQHTLNQKEFDLPERKIAKFFLFRCIFLGSSFAFANDPDFSWISNRQDYWDRRIDRFFSKYDGLAKQHDLWIKAATKGELISIPTGRQYTFSPIMSKKGEMVWPKKDIVCHPVQGLEAEMMKEYRIGVHNRLKELRPAILFSSIHDSLGVDTPSELRYNVRGVLEEEAALVPSYMKKYYGMDFDLPFRVEISEGLNMYDLEEV